MESRINRLACTQWVVKNAIFIIFVIGGAAILGISVAEENWVLLLVVSALPVVLLWPVQMSLGLFALVLPFDSVAVLGQGSTGTTLNWYAGVASALVLLGVGIVHGRLERPTRAALWWSLLILWSGASIVWALEPQRVLERLPTALGLLTFYLIAVSFRMSRKELCWVLGLALLGGVAGAGYGIWQFLHSTGASIIRASIGETNPNRFALSLLLPLSIAIGAFLSMRNWILKAATLTMIGVIAFAILISMSRGSLIAVCVLILFYIRKFRMNWRISVALLVLSSLLLAVPKVFFERIQSSQEDRGAGRLDIWQAGFEVAKNHTVFGVGLDNFPVAYDRYASSETFFRGYRRAPHNVYLGTLTELGIIGFLLFLLAIRSEIRVLRKLKSSAKQVPLVVGCEGACFAILTAGISRDILWDKTFWFSWILLATAARLQWPKEVVR
jgi:O-antigen ligase